MKIAIATMSRDISYGANLQAYSLQKKIKEICECECDHIAREAQKHSVFVKIRNPRNILTNLNRLVHYSNHSRKMNLFEQFQQRMSFTQKIYNDANAAELNELYDVFITGSDQVWNCENGMNNILFLRFASDEKKRIAYAASIGLYDIPNQYVDGFTEAVMKFDYISVREKRAKEIVFNLTGKECIDILDPVFLYSKEEWIRELTPRIIPNKYIYVYATQVTDEMLDAVKRCQQKTGYEVISVHKLLNYKTVEFVSGPLEFLNYIYNAEYVITSSFHCVAFSMIFGKRLTVIPHKSTGERVINVLNRLDASGCIYDGKFHKECCYEQSVVEEKIEKGRTEAINFLKTVLLKG